MVGWEIVPVEAVGLCTVWFGSQSFICLLRVLQFNTKPVKMPAAVNLAAILALLEPRY